MPIRNKEDNRDYQRYWNRALLERETPEEREERLSRKRANAKKRRLMPGNRDLEYQRDRRKTMNLDVTSLFEEAAWVWYMPEADSLVIRLLDQVNNEDHTMILIGKL
jgi:hypothetical protein